MNGSLKAARGGTTPTYQTGTDETFKAQFPSIYPRVGLKDQSEDDHHAAVSGHLRDVIRAGGLIHTPREGNSQLDRSGSISSCALLNEIN